MAAVRRRFGDVDERRRQSKQVEFFSLEVAGDAVADRHQRVVGLDAVEEVVLGLGVTQQVGDERALASERVDEQL